MDLKSQLEALGMKKGTAHITPASPDSRQRPAGIEKLVAGEVVENAGGACFVARLAHEPAYIHGSLPLRQFLELSSATLAQIGKTEGLAGVDLRDAVFVDTETTGLAGGTGTYAFLIGIGYFDDEQFIVEQFFMRDYGEEPAQLAALAERLERFSTVVSFNGKAFDLPLIETRLALSRIPSVWPARPTSTCCSRVGASGRTRSPPAHSRPWRRKCWACGAPAKTCRAT